MTAGALVRANGLGVRIGSVDVLQEVDVEFAPGTMTAVIGPSGSGKTTLFNVLARLQRITAGTVEINGEPIGASTARVGLVHQAFALLSLLTAAENVELAAQVLRSPRVETLDAAARHLAEVGMAERADHLVGELSGGEQQRVAFARAMITAPQVLLADEPTAQLDPENRENVIALLRAVADRGTTVLVATHDAEVATLCDSVVELRTGRVVGAHEEGSGRHHR